MAAAIASSSSGQSIPIGPVVSATPSTTSSARPTPSSSPAPPAASLQLSLPLVGGEASTLLNPSVASSLGAALRAAIAQLATAAGIDPTLFAGSAIAITGINTTITSASTVTGLYPSGAGTRTATQGYSAVPAQSALNSVRVTDQQGGAVALPSSSPGAAALFPYTSYPADAVPVSEVSFGINLAAPGLIANMTAIYAALLSQALHNATLLQQATETLAARWSAMTQVPAFTITDDISSSVTSNSSGSGIVVAPPVDTFVETGVVIAAPDDGSLSGGMVALAVVFALVGAAIVGYAGAWAGGCIKPGGGKAGKSAASEASVNGAQAAAGGDGDPFSVTNPMMRVAAKAPAPLSSTSGSRSFNAHKLYKTAAADAVSASQVVVHVDTTAAPTAQVSDLRSPAAQDVPSTDPLSPSSVHQPEALDLESQLHRRVPRKSEIRSSQPAYKLEARRATSFLRRRSSIGGLQTSTHSVHSRLSLPCVFARPARQRREA